MPRPNLSDTPPCPDRTSWCLALLLLVALCVRVWGLSHGLPDMSHGDEPEVVNHAVRFGTGDLNPHRFQYGTLFQYLLFFLYTIWYAAGRLLGIFPSVAAFTAQFIQDPTGFYLIARACSALLGTATVWLVYRIGRSIAGSPAGLWAAALLACCFQHVVHSHYCTVDVPLTFFFTLAVVAALRLLDTARVRDYLLAGLCCGLALGTKFDGALSGCALVTAHLLTRPGAGTTRCAHHLKLLPAGAAVLAGHFLACPFCYLDAAAALREAGQLHAMHSGGGFHLIDYIRHLLGEFWGVPLGAICLAGFVREIVVLRRKTVVLCLTIAAALTFKSMYRYVEAKYILYTFPLLAVCGGLLLADINRRLPAAAAVVLAGLLLAHPLSQIISWDHDRGGPGIDSAAREWIEATIPAGATILIDNVGNKGPKLTNTRANIRRQLERARRHNLMKAEHLHLLLKYPQPGPRYDLVQVNEPGGFRADDYQRYRLWQDLADIGRPASSYRAAGIQYVVITDRYESRMGPGLQLMRAFRKGRRAVLVYRVPQAEPSPD